MPLNGVWYDFKSTKILFIGVYPPPAQGKGYILYERAVLRLQKTLKIRLCGFWNCGTACSASEKNFFLYIFWGAGGSPLVGRGS